MTDITASCTFTYGTAGSIKLVQIVTPATAATSDTIDLGSDTANARGVKLKLILNTLVQDDVGADKTSTWAPATGIITLGSVTTGIHNLFVTGR